MESKKTAATYKKSFVLYTDFIDTLEHLTDKQAGIVFKAIYQWQLVGKLPALPLALKLVLTPIVSQFKRDNSKWEQICAKRSIAGKKGAKQKLANAGKRKQSLANLADSDSDSVNDKERAKRFVKPSLQELDSFIKSESAEKRKIAVSADEFFDFYESKGWKIGSSPMKDWKSAARRWIRKQPDQGETPHFVN